MYTIFIETIPTGHKIYEFAQTLTLDNDNLEERFLTENHDDRMIAAMTNLGKAARWLNDKQIERGAICIVSDKDGKDQRYGGEHDDLFQAIHSQSDYERNRMKYALIYGKHVAYLDRIRELANTNGIAFTQSQDVVTVDCPKE
jgi:hypothetical protein